MWACICKQLNMRTNISAAAKNIFRGLVLLNNNFDLPLALVFSFLFQCLQHRPFWTMTHGRCTEHTEIDLVLRSVAVQTASIIFYFVFLYPWPLYIVTKLVPRCSTSILTRAFLPSVASSAGRLIQQFYFPCFYAIHSICRLYHIVTPSGKAAFTLWRQWTRVMRLEL